MFNQTFYSELPSRTGDTHWTATYELENNNCKNFSVTIDYSSGCAPFYTVKQGKYSCPIAPVHVKDLIEILSKTVNDTTGDITRKFKGNDTIENDIRT